MNWTPQRRKAYVSQHIKRWCAEILGVAPEEIALRNGRCRHRNTSSEFSVPVARKGRSVQVVAFDVRFFPHDTAPRFTSARLQVPESTQSSPVTADAAPAGRAPAPQPISLSRKAAILLLVAILLIGLPAALGGIKLSRAVIEGLWAYSWTTADGIRNDGGYTFSFKTADKTGKEADYTSVYYNTHTRLRDGGEFGTTLLHYVSPTPELYRQPLLVYVHPLDPKHSILAPGIPVLAVYQLLALLIVVVPAALSLPLLWAGRKGKAAARVEAGLIPAAALFYLLSLLGASLYLALWSYLLRTMPPAWPLLAWSAASAFLFFQPGIARRLYGYKVVRRALYLWVVCALIPLGAIAAGLALPYVIATTVAIMALTVLVKPFARAGNSPLYALLISLFWVPLYIAGLLAPARALVQLLHEILPYMPYNIGITGIENPRVMAHLDVAVGVAGILLSLLATYVDSTWRARQAAQVDLLPTSKARSVAIGLVELQGRARHVSPAGQGPVLHYDSRHSEIARKQPFYLEDDTGRILIDPRASRFRTRWITSFGGRITEMVLKGREQLPDLSTPHVMTLLPGDPIYVIGKAQPNPDALPNALDSERLVVRRRDRGFFSKPFWQISQGKIRPQHLAEDIFFLADSKERFARRRIMKGIWQIWVWALVWIALSLAMFHFQLPRIQAGYRLWSMPEILQYAAPQDRLEAVLDFFERAAARSENENEDSPVFGFLQNTPFAGPLIETINQNLQHAQLTEGVNFLWDQHFKDAPLELVQVLVKSAGASNGQVRRWAVSRLREATAYPDLVVPVLIDALKHDPDPAVREDAASNLFYFGKAAFPAIPALVEAARSAQSTLRKNAVWSLTHLDEVPDGPAHDLFLELVQDQAEWVRRAGVQGLGNMACHSPHDAELLLKLAGDPDRYTRSLAIGAVAAIAPDTPGFPEVVMRALHDGEDVVRTSAVRALADFATIPDEAAAPLGAMITDKFLSGRILSLLIRMEERAAPAAPYLAQALRNRDSNVAYNAAFALSRIGKAAASAVNELLAALDHKNKYVRRYSAQALGGSGSAAVKAIPVLIEVQKDPDSHVSAAAKWAVAQIRKSQ